MSDAVVAEACPYLFFVAHEQHISFLSSKNDLSRLMV